MNDKYHEEQARLKAKKLNIKIRKSRYSIFIDGAPYVKEWGAVHNAMERQLAIKENRIPRYEY